MSVKTRHLPLAISMTAIWGGMSPTVDPPQPRNGPARFCSFTGGRGCTFSGGLIEPMSTAKIVNKRSAHLEGGAGLAQKSHVDEISNHRFKQQDKALVAATVRQLRVDFQEVNADSVGKARQDTKHDPLTLPTLIFPFPVGRIQPRPTNRKAPRAFLLPRSSAGVEKLFYRGSYALGGVGSVVTITPGEIHDGLPGHDNGWMYRMLLG